jgi:protein-L-isoaspartate(D-aspartate) O-methyltransferase
LTTTQIDQSALSARDAMIESQLRVSKVADERVIKAIRQVDRTAFVPADKRTVAYADTSISLLPGRAMMQPVVLGRLLAACDAQTHDRVLVVGAGTGYAAAVLARLAGQVTALEQNEELAGLARAALQGTAYVNVVVGPLVQGHVAAAPYDLIFIDGAVEFIPQALTDQLADTGLIVGVISDASVGRGFTARKAGGALGLNPFMDAFAPLLPGFAKAQSFSF